MKCNRYSFLMYKLKGMETFYVEFFLREKTMRFRLIGIKVIGN